MAPLSQTKLTTRFGACLLAAIAQRRRKQRAGGRAGEDAFLAQKIAGSAEALRVGDRVGLRDQRKVAVRRHEILADALDGPGAGLAHDPGLDERRQHRAGRIGEHHLGLRRGAAHVAPDAGERAAGADADHHRVEIAAHLLEDLGRGRRLVRGRVRRVGELVGIEGAGRPLGDRQRQVLVVVGVALADVGAGDDHLGAERAGVQDLLARHLVGDDEDGAVALARGDERKPDAGVAGRRLDDRAALASSARPPRRRRSWPAPAGP